MKNLIIQFKIRLITGLHIGGQDLGLSRGPSDKPVIRDAQGWPYIPGTSLRGKARSIFEQLVGSQPNKSVGKVQIHECTRDACIACLLFGVTAGNQSGAGASRVKFHDSFLTEESKDLLLGADTPTVGAELKTEAAIDRVTSAANPRTLERVVAGAVFQGQLVIELADFVDGVEAVSLLIASLNALQDMGLGGHTARGYGQVAVERITAQIKTAEVYAGNQPAIQLRDYESIEALVEDFGSFWAPELQ